MKVVKEKYERIEREVIQRLSMMEDIQGTLRISVNGNKIRYYHYSDEYVEKEKYIKKSNIELAKKVAQKTYYNKLLALIQRRLKEFRRLLVDYDEYEIDNAYDRLLPARKVLIVPIEKTISQRYEEWVRSEYAGKEFREGTPLILTDRGERVRSKSEKLIADYLNRNGIEYKYEKPLYLKGYGIIYPDFSFFSKKTGKELYWEHDGKMDDPSYARKAINKIAAYEENGIYLGGQLIISFETSDKVLGTKEIERLVQRFLV